MGKEIIRRISGYGVLNISQTVGRFCVQIAFARILTPEIFGTVALASVLLTVFTLIFRWGIPEAIMQNNEYKDIFSTIFWLRITTSISAFILIFVLTIFLRMYYPNDVVNVLLVLTVPQLLIIVGTPFKAAIQKEFRLTHIGAIQLIAFILGSIIGLFISIQYHGLWGLTAYYVVIKSVSSFGYLIISPEYPSFSYNHKTAKWFYGFAKKLFLTELFITAENYGDDHLIGTLANTSALGVYRIAWQLSSVFRIFIQPVLSEGITPVFSQMEKPKRVKENIEFIIRIQFYITVPSFILAGLVAPEIVSVLYGPKWEGVVPVLRSLTIAGILYPIVGTLGKFYQARNESSKFSRIQRVYILIMVLTMLILVPIYGGVGGAISMSITELVAVVLIFRQLNKDIGFSVAKVSGPSLITGLITAAIGSSLHFIRVWQGYSPILVIISNTALILIIFSILLVPISSGQVVEDFKYITTSLSN